MAEADDCLHRLSHAVCMVDGIALGIAAILENARTVAGADIDARLHVVIFNAVFGVLQNMMQLVRCIS